jgi:phosphatidylserine/phosphatidylglycerophosphate/cardiolipin synthase-like enzyme
LVDAVVALAALLPPDRVEALAMRLRMSGGGGGPAVVEGLLHTTSARDALREVLEAGAASGSSGEHLAGLLVGASEGRRAALAEQSVELVWTGPTAASTTTRRTDQVLLDVVRRAERDLFLVSFVAYDVGEVVDALNDACSRGVRVRFLLESPRSEGGSLDVDPIAAMRSAVPEAWVYAWIVKEGDYTGGRVHAKVAVADWHLALLSSANLTGHALGKNMEAGVLVEGGRIPSDLRKHLQALIDTMVVRRV